MSKNGVVTDLTPGWQLEYAAIEANKEIDKLQKTMSQQMGERDLIKEDISAMQEALAELQRNLEDKQIGLDTLEAKIKDAETERDELLERSNKNYE